MAEYIDREEYCEKHCRCNNEYCDKESCPIWKAPVADVAPVVHGTWVPTEFPFMNECEDCSVCGYRTVWGHRYNYCPNCGAKMDGAK